MIEWAKAKFIKYKEAITYLFFGGCTTVINIIVFQACIKLFGIHELVSNIIAWIIAVAFAYITNKLWVFESRAFDENTLKREIPEFFGARLATLGIEELLIYVTVTLLNGSPLVWKIISNIIVILLNYVASKLFIFKRNKG